jgi:hypothetical protein
VALTNEEQLEIAQWIEVAKGDKAGHRFHGNQWEKVGADGGTAGTASHNVKTPHGQSDGDIKAWAKKIAISLNEGKHPNINGSDLPKLFTAFKELDSGNPDISKLRINGTELMGGQGKGLLRSQMPQIPPSEREAFLDWAREEHGVIIERKDMDPTLLKPIQSEISGTRSGWLFTKYENGGIPREQRILVSKDNYIIDGHHTWGASVGLKFLNNDYNIHVYQMDLNWRDALNITHEYAAKMGYEAQTLEGKKVDGTTSNLSKEAEGHAFHGNQHTGGLGGAGKTETPRQIDPNRYEVPEDRNESPKMDLGGIFDSVKAEGGVTASTIGEGIPTSGYFCAMGNPHADQAPISIMENEDDFTKFTSDFLQKNAELLAEKGNFLGIFKDEETGTVDFDVSQHFSDLEEAKQAGASRDQKSIWDIGNSDIIDTGGSGKIDKSIRRSAFMAKAKQELTFVQTPKNLKEMSRAEIEDFARNLFKQLTNSSDEEKPTQAE